MKVSNAFFLSLAVLVTLSACGASSQRKQPAPVNNGQTSNQTNGEQTAFKEEELAALNDGSKCQNDIPVDQPSEGFKEVALDKLALPNAKGQIYQLITTRAHATVLTADQRVISGSTLSQVSDQGIEQKVDCKDLLPGDELEMPSHPVYQLNAASGRYGVRAGLQFLLKDDADQQSNKIYEVNTPGSYYDLLKKAPQDRELARARGEDLIIKAYKDAQGNLEIRTAQLKPTRYMAHKMMLHTLIRYQLMVAPQDGAQK